MRQLACYCLLAACLAAIPHEASAHAGVFMQQGVCMLRIGFFRANLELYQPQARQHRKFCEAVPEAAETVFVMEYLHGPLEKAPIEFRIIRDITGRGAYATRGDIARAGDLHEATVFYRPAATSRDVFSVVHDFDEPGWYIGMVTIEHPTLNKAYTAIFPFEVGFTGLGRWPWLAVLAIVVQLHYWHIGGHLTRWRAHWHSVRNRSRRPARTKTDR